MWHQQFLRNIRLLFLSFIILWFSCPASADIYRDVVSDSTIELDSSWRENENPYMEDGWYISRSGNTIYEGEYKIAKTSQYIYFWPVSGEEKISCRYASNLIFAGEPRTIFWANSPIQVFNTKGGGSSRDGFGFLNFKNYSASGAEIVGIRGGIYDAQILAKHPHFKYYQEIFDWVIENGKDYILGYYDEGMFERRFMFCAYTKEALRNSAWDIRNAVYYAWSDTFAYPQIYFPEDTELYAAASAAWKSVMKRTTMSYEHAMGIPTRIILMNEAESVRSDSEDVSLLFQPNGAVSYHRSLKDRVNGTWNYAEDKLTLSFEDGSAVTGEGAPMTLNFPDGQVFTLLFSVQTPAEDPSDAGKIPE